MQNRNVTVVLIVKNESTIKDTLLLLKPQIDELHAECIVVDASSPTLLTISEELPWVNWITFKSAPALRKATIAEQRNVGVRNSKGEVIAFCDAGGSPQPGWLKAVTDPILSGEAFLTGGPIFASNLESLNPWINNQGNGETINYPTTANLAVSRSAFDLIGGFNEELSYGSDADFVWRLEREGVLQIAVADAVMGLDGGDRKRERKRTWKYGRAIVDLLRNFPEKRASKFLNSPEIWVYPLLEIEALGSLIAIWLSLRFALVGGSLFLLLNLILMLRNRGLSHPWEFIVRRYIYATAILYQLVSVSGRRFHLSPTLIYPPDKARYLMELRLSLKSESVSFQDFPSPTPSNFFNVLVLPFQSLSLRVRGARILHIHWLYRFNMTWTGSRLSRKLLQLWFYLWLYSLRVVGIQIVWTAHNLLPHDQIFSDDLMARRFLVRNSAAVIALSDNAREELISNFGAKNVLVIPEGPLFHLSTISREEMRKKLQVADSQTLIVAIGRLSSYKGLSDLLRASEGLDKSLAIRIAGRASGTYQYELSALVKQAQIAGVDVQIQYGEINNEDYGAYLKAADFYAAPFKEITNSGSINAALAANIPVIIPNMESLEWVPQQAAIRFPTETNRIEALSESLRIVIETNIHTKEEMRAAAKKFTELRNWVVVAKRHRALYKNLLRQTDD